MLSTTTRQEPYRVFFPLGTFLGLLGILIWVPLIWNEGATYPILLHRYLMLNGFTASFIGGFLMTAVPRFSKTGPAESWEMLGLLVLIVLGCVFAHLGLEGLVFSVSGLQPMSLLLFLGRRIPKRKANPPYSFLFLFAGLILWALSAFLFALTQDEIFKWIHQEGAIGAIILGVGSKLIPGILGHTAILPPESTGEKPVSIMKTVPLHFFIFIGGFVASYFMEERAGLLVRGMVVLLIALMYWRLYQAPKVRTALTWSIWVSSWLITLSFVARWFFWEAGVHVSHSFFINGIILLSLLVGTRVLVSHGPKIEALEDSRSLYVITGLIILASATRVSAYYLPESYLTHLAYGSLILSAGIILWAARFLRFARG